MSLEHTDVTAPIHHPLQSDCARVGSILARLGDKWTVLVVMLLGGGPRRFNEIKRMVNGISQRMLTLPLRTLERDGMVLRTADRSSASRICDPVVPCSRTSASTGRSSSRAWPRRTGSSSRRRCAPGFR